MIRNPMRHVLLTSRNASSTEVPTTNSQTTPPPAPPKAKPPSPVNRRAGSTLAGPRPKGKDKAAPLSGVSTETPPKTQGRSLSPRGSDKAKPTGIQKPSLLGGSESTPTFLRKRPSKVKYMRKLQRRILLKRIAKKKLLANTRPKNGGRPRISIRYPRKWNPPIKAGILPAYDEALKVIWADSKRLKREARDLKKETKQAEVEVEKMVIPEERKTLEEKLEGMRQKLNILEVQSEVNLPHVRWNVANAMGERTGFPRSLGAKSLGLYILCLSRHDDPLPSSSSGTPLAERWRPRLTRTCAFLPRLLLTLMGTYRWSASIKCTLFLMSSRFYIPPLM